MNQFANYFPLGPNQRSRLILQNLLLTFVSIRARCLPTKKPNYPTLYQDQASNGSPLDWIMIYDKQGGQCKFQNSYEQGKELLPLTL